MKIDKIIFYLFLFSIGLESSPVFENISVFRIVIFPLSIIGLFIIVLRSGLNLESHKRLLLFIAIFLVFNLLSRFSSDPYISFFNIIGIFIFIVYLLLYLDKYGLDSISLLMIASFALPHIYAYIYYGLGYDKRFFGLHTDSNFLAANIVISSMSIFLYYWKKTTIIRLTLFITLVSINVYLIIITGSRGAILSIVILLLIMISYTKRWIFILVIPTVVVAFQIIADFVLSLTWERSFNPLEFLMFRYQRIFVDIQEEERFYLYSKAINLLAEGKSIFIGYTNNKFNESFGHFPHSYIVDIVMETGLLIGGLFVIYIIYLTIHGYRFAAKGQVNYNYFMISMSGFTSLFFLSAYRNKLFWFLFILLYYAGTKLIKPATND